MKIPAGIKSILPVNWGGKAGGFHHPGRIPWPCPEKGSRISRSRKSLSGGRGYTTLP